MSARGLVSWLLLLLCTLGWGAPDALILIQHDAAGPNLPSADYIHGEWIRWPQDQGNGRNNRILSLMTGQDLQSEVADGSFRANGEGWLSTNGERLTDRGVFAARDAYLGKVPTFLLANSHGTVSATVRLLGLTGPRTPVVPRRYEVPLPSEGLILYEAEDWDHAIGLTKRVGRSLIVEFPPDGVDSWSRFWLYGAWPAGVPTEPGVRVPGLIHARQALALLLRPLTFAWHASDAGRWSGPNRWLEHGRDLSPGVLLVWFSVAAVIVAWAIAQVMNEDRGPFVSELLVALSLTPAAMVLAGAMEHLGGLEAWLIWLIFASLTLYGLSSVLLFAGRRWWPDAHPLWAPCLLGLGVLALFDPLWSDFSNRFGPLDLDVSGAAVGAALAYFTGAVAFAPGRGFGRYLTAAALLWGATAQPWWIGGHSALLVLPAVALAASEGVFRPVALIFLALLPTGLVRVVREGIAWNPLNLLAVAGQGKAINFWQHFAFGISEGWVGTLTLIALGLLLGTRFLAYRLHKLLRLDPRLRAFPWIVAATLAVGVTEPLVLPAVPVLTFGTLIVLAYDGLRANA